MEVQEGVIDAGVPIHSDGDRRQHQARGCRPRCASSTRRAPNPTIARPWHLADRASLSHKQEFTAQTRRSRAHLSARIRGARISSL